jgi:hypothetical protein
MENDRDIGQQEIDEINGNIKDCDKDVKAMEAKVQNTVELRRQLMNDRNKEMNNMEVEDFN